MQSGRALAIALALLALVAISALLPPFFTDGKCTAEFDAGSAQVQAAGTELASVEKAKAYLTAHDLPFAEISAEECERSMPPGVESCSDGPLILTFVAVKDPVCRFYRDDRVRVQLRFGRSLQLRRIEFGMQPYKILTLPFGHHALYWAR